MGKPVFPSSISSAFLSEIKSSSIILSFYFRQLPAHLHARIASLPEQSRQRKHDQQHADESCNFFAESAGTWAQKPRKMHWR
jgi:hypothetical protein